MFVSDVSELMGELPGEGVVELSSLGPGQERAVTLPLAPYVEIFALFCGDNTHTMTVAS